MRIVLQEDFKLVFDRHEKAWGLYSVKRLNFERQKSVEVQTQFSVKSKWVKARLDPDSED